MTPPRLEVVAAVLADGSGRVLLDQRPAGKPHAGWWEFPGGKLEAGETPRDGLVRELHEELGIEVLAAAPLFTLTHVYPEREVRLHCWRVSAWRGTPAPHDGQGLAWHAPAALPGLQVLPADKPLVDWLRGPDRIAITPAPGDDLAAFLDRLARCCAEEPGMVQLRAPGLEDARYAALAHAAHRITAAAGLPLVLNCAPELARELPGEGLHLNSRRLAVLDARPVPTDRWLTASVHDAAEISRARALGVDLLLVAPVKPTASHPGAKVLGWDGFSALAADAGLPCYALGGLALGDLARARAAGGRGIATLGASWPE